MSKNFYKKSFSEISLFYFITIFIFLILKIAYKFSSNNEILILLKPIVFCVELFFGTKSIYVFDKGFIFKDLGVIIDKSCSGFNFMLIIYLMISFMWLPYFFKIKKIKQYPFFILSITIILSISYFLSIFVTFARIVIAISFKKIPITDILSFINPESLHKTQGAFTYLFFLICFYFLFNFLLKKINNNNENLI